MRACTQTNAADTWQETQVTDMKRAWLVNNKKMILKDKNNNNKKNTLIIKKIMVIIIITNNTELISWSKI